MNKCGPLGEVARIDDLRRQLANAEEEKRRWGYKMNQARKGSAEFEDARRRGVEFHNRARKLQREIDRLGG